MSERSAEDGGVRARRRSASDVVEVSLRGDGFAYAPGEMLFRAPAEDRLRAAALEMNGQEDVGIALVSDRPRHDDALTWHRATGVIDPLRMIDLLTAEGYDAQPNHAFFAHGCGNPCPPHPAVVQELVRGGLLADPLRANPIRANPIRANPLRANPIRANSPMENSAVPAPGRRMPRRDLAGAGPTPTIVVLDTGVAQPAAASGSSPASDYGSPLLNEVMTKYPGRISGTCDLPDRSNDRYLDPAAGHGTFIAGVIEQLAPGCTIEIHCVMDPLGVVVEADVVREIDGIALAAQNDRSRPVILNLSFGGPALGIPHALREAVANAVAAGIVVVASAGNDGICTPQYPAAFPNVIAVAALGPDGPAPWTNYGDWVDACAPGTDLVSAFFSNFDGAFPTKNTYDQDRFTGWAEWSGTSFAAPVVVAAIARELRWGRGAGGGPIDLGSAVDHVIHAPHLARLPCLGTIVNI